MAEGSLRYSSSSRLLLEGSRTLRSAQCRPLRHKGQSASSTVRLVETRPGVRRDRCLHVPAQGREPLLFSSGGLHPSSPSRSSVSAGHRHTDRSRLVDSVDAGSAQDAHRSAGQASGEAHLGRVVRLPELETHLFQDIRLAMEELLRPQGCW